jgi:hypothetical protein
MTRRCLIFLFLLLLLSACHVTNITSSWKADQIDLHGFEKVLVLGIIPDSSRALRQNMEKALTNQLKDRGINAVSAFDEFGPKVFKKITEGEVDSQIKKKGFDAVITITLLNKRKERYYIPARVEYTPFWYDYSFFWGYYSSLYGRIYEPGYYTEDTRYFWESNLYDLKRNKLLYSVQGNAFNIADAESYGNDYAKVIIKDLMRRKP